MHLPSNRELLTYDTTKEYSPLILNNEWPTLLRLVFLSLLTTAGTIINGFFVASFFIIDPLRTAGNVYLASIGIADMVITTVVMPASVFVLISKVWEVPSVCYTLQFLCQGSTYTYSLLFMMVSIETYIRLCRTRACYSSFISVSVGLVTSMIFILSFAVSGVGVYLELDYDYCTRNSHGNYLFRLVTSLVLHAIPFLCTVLTLGSSASVVRDRAIRLAHYKRSYQYDRDYAFTNLNIACYTLFVLFWIPYLLIVNIYPDTTDSYFYSSVWLGLSRSLITSLIYSIFNNNFRRGFSNLYFYCCCKRTINAPLNPRHHRTYEHKTTRGGVRVHILHHSMVPGSQRDCCSRDEPRYTSEI